MTLLGGHSWKLVPGFLWTSSYVTFSFTHIALYHIINFTVINFTIINSSWEYNYMLNPMSHASERSNLEVILGTPPPWHSVPQLGALNSPLSICSGSAVVLTGVEVRGLTVATTSVAIALPSLHFFFNWDVICKNERFRSPCLTFVMSLYKNLQFPLGRSWWCQCSEVEFWGCSWRCSL